MTPATVKTEFVILGPIVDEEATYWNVPNWAWTKEYFDATTFDKEIMTSPLPEGGVGYMEIVKGTEYPVGVYNEKGQKVI